MEAIIKVRVEFDEELGNTLGAFYPLFQGAAYQEHELKLEGDALRKGLPLLVPYVERFGMTLSGEAGEPLFSHLKSAHAARVAAYLVRNMKVRCTTSLRGEEDRRDIPVSTLLSHVSTHVTGMQ